MSENSTPKKNKDTAAAVSSVKKEKAAPKPKVPPKPIPVYDNKQRELKSVTVNGVCKFQVTYDNKVVYLDKSLDDAIAKYNSSGVIKMILPVPPERKKTPPKKKDTKASAKPKASKKPQIEKLDS